MNLLVSVFFGVELVWGGRQAKEIKGCVVKDKMLGFGDML